MTNLITYDFDSEPLIGELLHEDKSLAKIVADGQSKTPAQLYVNKHSSDEARRVATVKVNQVALLLGFPNADAIRWDIINYTHANNFKAKLQTAKNLYGETLAPATINHTITAFRQMAKCAWLMRIINVEQLEVLRSLEQVKGSRAKQRNLPMSEDIEKLLDSCFTDPSASGPRDAAIIVVAFGAGLRRSEIANLMFPRHINEANSNILVRGKGNKERIMPLEPYMLDIIQTWIYDVRGEHTGPLFSRIRKGDDIQNSPLTPAAIRYILEQRCLKAGVDIIRPHDARHTFASSLIKHGADIVAVKNLLGHSSITTTERYIHKDQDDMVSAVRDNFKLFGKFQSIKPK